MDKKSVGRSIARPARRVDQLRVGGRLGALDFIDAGRATTHRDHRDVTDIEAAVTGDLLIEIFTETEKRTGKTLLERDGHPSIQCVNEDDTYHIRFIEF
jgi:hypothetical protein